MGPEANLVDFTIRRTVCWAERVISKRVNRRFPDYETTAPMVQGPRNMDMWWALFYFINIDYDDVIPRNVYNRFICYFFLITSFTVLTKIPNFCGYDLISVNIKYFCQNVH